MFSHFGTLQVSLRDPLRAGVDDLGLKEIIGAAVCLIMFAFYIVFENFPLGSSSFKFIFLVYL